MKDDQSPAPNDAEAFEKQAQGSQGLLRNLCGFLWHTRKWWLAPILICLVLLGLLMILGGTGAAPYIYTLF